MGSGARWRTVALVTADGIALTVVFTVVFTDHVVSTGEVVRRLICARLSNRKERRQYVEALEAIRAQGEPDEGAR